MTMTVETTAMLLTKALEYQTVVGQKRILGLHIAFTKVNRQLKTCNCTCITALRASHLSYRRCSNVNKLVAALAAMKCLS